MIYFAGNMKWSFNPPGSGEIIDVERIQTKWDREQAAKIRVRLGLGRISGHFQYLAGYWISGNYPDTRYTAVLKCRISGYSAV